MVQAIAIIQSEHRSLAAVLNCLVNVVRDIESRDLAPDFELLSLIVDYLDSFLYRFHHPKEDYFLFDALRRRRPELAELIEELEEEHRLGESLTERLSAALDSFERNGAAGFADFRDAVEAYCDFERAHIVKEERDIVPQARRYLAAEDWHKIDEAFVADKDPLFSDELAEKYRKLFSAIANAAPAPFGLGSRSGPKQVPGAAPSKAIQE